MNELKTRIKVVFDEKAQWLWIAEGAFVSRDLTQNHPLSATISPYLKYTDLRGVESLQAQAIWAKEHADSTLTAIHDWSILAINYIRNYSC
jgi:hypothetical protein